jgi:hypothetical protein
MGLARGCAELEDVVRVLEGKDVAAIAEGFEGLGDDVVDDQIA